MEDYFGLDLFREFELWLNGLLAHHKHTGLPFGKKRPVALNRDFREDIRTSLKVVQDLCTLSQEILESEIDEVNRLNPGLELISDQEDFKQQIRQNQSYASRVDAVINFWDFLDQFKLIGLSLARFPHISRKEFKAFGFVLTDQITRLKRSDAYIYLKKKSFNWEFHHILQRDIVSYVDLGGIREQLEHIFMEFFQILSVIQYLKNEMSKQFKPRKLMILFIYCYFSIRSFLKLLENSREYLGNYQPEIVDAMFSTSFALKMETRKVFSEKLLDLENEKKINVVYAHMEDALGLLQNALRESFVGLIRLLNPNFDELGIFTDLAQRFDDTQILLQNLNHLYRLSVESESTTQDAGWTDLRSEMRKFQDSSMRFLFFKDWQTFEQFDLEFRDCSSAERSFVLHRFEVYVSTLIGEVRKRSVLGKFKKRTSLDGSVSESLVS